MDSARSGTLTRTLPNCWTNRDSLRSVERGYTAFLKERTMPNDLNVFKIHFQYDTKASVWLHPTVKAKHIANEVVIPARSIVLAQSGGMAYDGTLILDIRVPMPGGIERVGLHVQTPHAGNINFFAEDYHGYKRFDFDSLVHSFIEK